MRCTLFCSLCLIAILPVYGQEPATAINESSLPKSLDEMLAGKRSLDTFRLDVKWIESGKESSITIYGDGLGIHWQGKQFQLSKEKRLDLLRKIKTAKFLTMLENLGELPKGAKSSKQPAPGLGRGKISLQIGKESK